MQFNFYTTLKLIFILLKKILNYLLPLHYGYYYLYEIYNVKIYAREQTSKLAHLFFYHNF